MSLRVGRPAFGAAIKRIQDAFASQATHHLGVKPKRDNLVVWASSATKTCAVRPKVEGREWTLSSGSMLCKTFEQVVLEQPHDFSSNLPHA